LALAAKEDHIGRLAVIDGRSPLVAPLNFTVHDRLVFVRIGPGRLAELVSNSLVAFEVDRVEPDGSAAWSVLVRGLASVVSPADVPSFAIPQPWVPEAGEEVLSVRPDLLTGRRFRLVDRDGNAGPGSPGARSR